MPHTKRRESNAAEGRYYERNVFQTGQTNEQGYAPAISQRVHRGHSVRYASTTKLSTMTGASRKPPRVEQILRTLRLEMPELQTRYAVESLGVFGSYVRGQNRRRSDLDVLVEFDRAPTMFQFFELREHLTKLLGIEVDLVMKRALKPSIGERILAEVVPV
ncbi:MAG: nucleotidyltransferase family protein [Chloroflexota bacterium]